MEFLDLFVISSIPVLKVLLVTAVGSFLALDRVNLMGEDARKYFNNLVFYVLNPPLIATNLAQTITLDSVIKLWFMPLNILITFILGSAFGWVVIQITRAPSHLRGLILGCCAAGNLGNMLLIIIPAVCKEKGSPFGAPDTCHTFGMAYASLSMAIGAIYLWSYVYNIVRFYSTRQSAIEVSRSIEGAAYLDDNCKQALLLPKDPSISEDYQYHIALPYDTSNESTKVPVFVKFKQQLAMVEEKLNLKKVFAPSTIGAIVGFVLGVVPQLRKLLIGESAPLRVIQDSASLLSDGAIPILTLIVGGNLVKGLRGSGIQMSLILGIVVVRYVLLPLSGILIIKAAIRFGLIHLDPLYQFVLLLQYALPPAMNIGTMTQLFGTGESECSVIMLWTYALASISLTLWSTLFMWLVS
ncbi:Auxin efflux carrier-like protein [Thalictrum thalictroides]|uniref:Auxin efflux carrier-like protein n=1 Tax=Thalictrum thalictroides TaxID=46969 RepID=A0A7J6X3Q4_THATH|nr:Auxin efflux carrier-like protein [Thalictrum thalictroides]